MVSDRVRKNEEYLVMQSITYSFEHQKTTALT